MSNLITNQQLVKASRGFPLYIKYMYLIWLRISSYVGNMLTLTRITHVDVIHLHTVIVHIGNVTCVFIINSTYHVCVCDHKSDNSSYSTYTWWGYQLTKKKSKMESPQAISEILHILNIG